MNGFVRMSKLAGQREDMTQAGGGNSAFKRTDKEMLIKASGFSLADISEESGYAIVDYSLIRDFFLNYKNLDELKEDEAQSIIRQAYLSGNRPSIETFLHAVSQKYSLHIHSIAVNILTSRIDGDEELHRLFPDALIVPYATPGIELAKIYFKTYKEYVKCNNSIPEVVFLMSHGLLVSGNDSDYVSEKVEWVLKTIEEYLGLNFDAYRTSARLQDVYGSGIIWKVTDYNVLEALKCLGKTWNIAVSPDSVIFLGKSICFIENEDNLKCEILDHQKKYGLPKVIVMNDSIYLHADSVKKALEMQSVLSFNAQVCLANKNSHSRLLTDDEMNELLELESEKYRQSLK